MLLKVLIFYTAVTTLVQADDHEPLFLDMSYNFKEGETIYWPNVDQPYIHPPIYVGDDYGFWYESYSFCAPEHGGTHLDAPSHFYEGGHRVHEIPLDTLIGPVIKIDMKAKADLDRDAELNVTDIEEWEETYGTIPDDVILMVYTGWGARYPDKLTFLGTDTNDTSLLHFPGIHPDAAQWLVDNRKVKAVGIDTASLDYGQSFEFRTHVILFSKNIPGLENVANLDQLPTTGATIYMLPINIYDGSGAPCRIFATEWKDGLVDPYKVDRSTPGGQSPYLQHGGNSPYLDMTHPLKEGETPQWPDETVYDLEIVYRGLTDVGFHYETNQLCTAEHIGSHIDAPVHFKKYGTAINDVSLEALIGPAIKIDIAEKAWNNSEAMMEVSDLEEWEEENGQIPDDVILLVHTGWHCRWPDVGLYSGTTTNDYTQLHFPGIHPDAAQWLVDNRKIKAVGIDTLSLDFGQTQDFGTHQILLDRNITGFENVANLHLLPAKGATVFGIPMKIYEGSAAPARMFATGWNPDLPDICSGQDCVVYSISVILICFLSNIFI